MACVFMHANVVLICFSFLQMSYVFFMPENVVCVFMHDNVVCVDNYVKIKCSETEVLINNWLKKIYFIFTLILFKANLKGSSNQNIVTEIYGGTVFNY